MIRVLVLSSDSDGVGYYRTLMPHLCMKDPDIKVEVRLLTDMTLPLLDINFLRHYSIIFYNKVIPFADPQKEQIFLKMCKDLNIKIIYDIDDYWILDPSHLNYKNWKQNKSGEKVENLIKMADVVTTTTSIFADRIREINPNVFVLENAINVEEQQWCSNKTKSNRVRFIWGGGISHRVDLKLIQDEFKKFDKYFLNNAQMVMCGYDLRIKMQDGTIKKDDHNRSQWGLFENMFTGNGRYVKSLAYSDFLRSSDNFNNDDTYGYKEEFIDEFYQRRHTKPILHYGTMYNEADISIAPLKNNHSFNLMKCIVGDSLISTTNGIYEIEDIINNKNNLSTEINGTINNIENYFKYENEKTIKITTKFGYNIEGTPSHRIFINGKWVMLEELKINDKIELTKPYFLQTEYQYITYPMLLTKNNENKIENSNNKMLPRIIINERWGRLLGYLLGDGHLGGKSMIGVSMDNRNQDIIDDVMNLFESIGLNPKLYIKKPDKRCKNSLCKEGFGVDMKLTSKTFIEISKKYGLIGKNGKIFRIPKVILKSPKSVIKEFLMGLFESDGTVSIHSSVSLTSKDKKLIEQVQYLLLGFGITSKITHSYNKHYRKYYYNLILGRQGSDIFYKEINFISKKKKEILEKFVNGKRSNNEHKMIFEDVIEKIEHNVNTVFDIEIKNVHSYNANGIINHNSQLKLIESGCHKMPIIMSNYGPYTLDDVDGAKNGIQKGWLIDENKSNWYEKMKWYVDNPNAIREHGDANHEYFMKTFEMKVVNKKRAELYKYVASQNRGEVKLD